MSYHARSQLTCLDACGLTFTVCVPVAEIPPLPAGFANLTVPTTVLAPTLPQQLDMHFLATNNTLSAKPLYFIFIGETWLDAASQWLHAFPSREKLPLCAVSKAQGR